jgi:hypothetical protein
MLMLVDDAVVEHEIVDDAVAVLVNFRAVDAPLDSAARETWRKVQKPVSAANLAEDKVERENSLRMT